MQEALGTTTTDMHGDLLVLAFNQACLGGHLGVASSLLQRLDAALLGDAMGWEQREASLKLMRSLRDRLEDVRKDAGAVAVADIYQPQHHMIA